MSRNIDDIDLELSVRLVNKWQAEEAERKRISEEECRRVRDNMFIEPTYYVSQEQEKRVERREVKRRTFMEEFDLTPGDILRVAAGVIGTAVVLIGIFKFMQIREENFQKGLSNYESYTQWVHDNGYEFSADTFARYNSNNNTYNISNGEKGL